MSMCTCLGLDECQCSCHTQEGVVHCAPCCGQCPHCGRNIHFWSYDQHVAKCKAEWERLGAVMENMIKVYSEVTKAEAPK